MPHPKFKFLKKSEISQTPKNPGIYAFKKGGEILYIGKAANLRERIKNHLPERSEGRRRTNVLRPQQPVFRDNFFINQVEKVGFIKTDSEIEALILEANLIKKYQPKYNVVWKDDKNYFFVGITGEDYPRVFIAHQLEKFRIPSAKWGSAEGWEGSGSGRESFERSGSSRPWVGVQINSKYQIPNSKPIYIGPFVEGRALKKTLRMLRKIFPYYTVKKHPKVACPWCHLGLCPGPHPDKKEYAKNIKNLVAMLKGKRKSILKCLRRGMRLASKRREFEKAAKIRDQIEALEKVISHAKVFSQEISGDVESKPWQSFSRWEETEKKLRRVLDLKNKISRIEAYDVSNIQGQKATGSMVTFINGLPDKNFYRKFKVKITGKPNDIAMLKEVLSRRLKHKEWPFPDLILIDGGIGQLSAALQIKNLRLKTEFPFMETRGKMRTEFSSPIKEIRFISLAKRENTLYIEGQKQPILLKTLPREIFNLILQLRDEAHRFALSYHLKLRDIDLKNNF